MYTAVILAGGKGIRMGKEMPKQFIPLAGKPMIMHTLERMEKIKDIDEVVIVCLPEFKDFLKNLIDNYMLKKRIVLVDAGKIRQESTLNGVKAASHEDVIIHEAARPFVTTEDFRKLIEAAAECATFGIAIPFTVLTQKDGAISSLLDREKLVNIQLPQKFKKNILKEALLKAREENRVFTEDASAVYYYFKETVAVVPGSSYNIKVTEPVDLLVGEYIYSDYIVGRD